MRITEAYLENNACLLEGTGRSEIAIDFRPAFEAGLRRIMLFGRNGSGKSTLLGALNPFPDSADGRVVTVPGRAGRKVVSFARQGHPLVTCDVRWSSKGKTSCQLQLDGATAEETAKGNVGEYLRAVKMYLGVTPSYLTIGHVGGNIDGFLEMKPGPRKAYIGKFMPEVEEWAAMHRHVGRRLLALGGELKGIQVELDRIEPRAELEAEVGRAEGARAAAAEAARAAERSLGQVQGALDEMGRARAEVLARHGLAGEGGELNPAAGALAAARRARASARQGLEELLASRPALEPFRELEAAREKAASLRVAIGNADGQMEGAVAARSSARGRLDSAISAAGGARSRLRGVQGAGAQAAELEAQLAQRRAQLAAAEASPGLLHPAAGSDLTYDEVKRAADALQELEGGLAAARAAFSSPAALERCAAALFDASAVAEAARRDAAALAHLRERREAVQARIAGTEAQLVFHRQFAGMRCADPRCPFERAASSFARVPEELRERREEAEALAARVAAAEAAQGAAAQDAAASRSALALHAQLRRHQGALATAGVWGRLGPLPAFAALLSSSGTAAAEVLETGRLLEAVAARRDLTEARRLLQAVEERLAAVRAQASAREQIEEAAARAEEAEAAARSEFDAAAAAHAALEKKRSGLEQAAALVGRIVELHGQAAAAEAAAASLEEASAALEAMRARWEEASATAAAAQLSLDAARHAERAAQEALTQGRLKQGRRDDYEARLAAVDGRVSVARAVAEACHPARGAPVELIRGFLETTERMTNDLLDVALGGEFRIGFELSSEEFRIPVFKGSGRRVDDVTEVSDGQLALAKTVVSMALVKQTVLGAGGYNIVMLDEIDGPLDREKNRERFGAIISRLVADLGIEQLMGISHNDSFYAEPAGLVLLPGHSMPLGDPSFMDGKLVLANFE